MKWPRSLKVLGTIYKVEYKKDIECDGEMVDGTCDGVTRTIEVDVDLLPGKKLEVLLHEFGHAVEYELCIEHIRDKDSGPYEVHLLIDHIARETVKNWDKLKGLEVI